MIESIAAESPKFTAPMVLVHGLWCTAGVWRKFMGYMAHRGWACHALTLRGHAELGVADLHVAAPGDVPVGRVRFADHLGDLRQVVAACDAPPVVIGHDLGGLLALCCAAPDVRAVVALAPLVPLPIGGQPNRALSALRSRLAIWRARPLPAPRGKIAAEYFGSGAPGGTVPDSGFVAGELRRRDLPLPASTGTPTLVLAGEHDAFSPPAALARLAQRVGATFRQTRAAGHAMPWGAGWEALVSEVHRWLIQSLGDSLLAVGDDVEQ